jgi:hypothetical protein
LASIYQPQIEGEFTGCVGSLLVELLYSLGHKNHQLYKVRRFFLSKY